MFESWEALYRSEAQGLWALLVLPTIFLAWLAVRGWTPGPGVEPRAASFVRAWALVFGLVAIVDVVAAGPLGWPLLPFVLLGDYRVLALALVVMEPTRARSAVLLEAAAWTLVVPAAAWVAHAGLGALLGAQPEMTLWLAYEIAFAILASVLTLWLVPRRAGSDRPAVRAYLQSVLGLVVLYYVLWVAADVAILAGADRGWALRIVPNQLYYGLLVPLAYALFFAAPQAASRTSTQAAR